MQKQSNLQSYYAVNTKEKAIKETHRWNNVMQTQLMKKNYSIITDVMIKIRETTYPTSKYYIR